MKQAKYKVVITPCDYDNIGLERSILEPIDAEVIRIETYNEREIMEVAKDADALLVQYTEITREFIKNLERCKVMVRYGVGYDNFDVEAATEYGIYAANVPDYCIDEVSTHTLALLLALERKVILYNEDLKKEIWNPHLERPIFNLRKQTLGIIGFGRIGRAFCLKAKPIFGKVVVCDPYIDESIFDEYEVEKDDFERVLQQSDLVSLHVPLIKKPTEIYDQITYHLIGEKQFKMMKKTAYIINTARGAVIDDRALRKALAYEWIAGAGLDVIENEPPEEEGSEPSARYRTLLETGRLIITPHSAYLSEESIKEVRTRAAREVVRVLQEGMPPKALLNPEVKITKR